MSAVADQTGRHGARIGLDELARFCTAALSAVGADEATAEAATRAMIHGSRCGVDSHGVRLLPHYATVLREGRVNPRPTLAFASKGGAVATLDADDAHGALATYSAMDRAVEIAGGQGIGAVAIRKSSHFGPAGAYALAAAERGAIGIVMCNSDAFVRLHGGARRFHGTNPIACAIPNPDGEPWLLDMATSAIPYNRVKLYESLGVDLPEAVASDAEGRNTADPAAVEMLAPLGAAFGFKGAGLAGLVEIFSAVLSGMGLSFDLLPMGGPDLSTPRGLGAFVMAVRTDAFVDREIFDRGMRRYVGELRASATARGAEVMAPGDREWAEAERRTAYGAPVDPATMTEFRSLADRYGLEMPATAGSGSTPPAQTGAS